MALNQRVFDELDSLTGGHWTSTSVLPFSGAPMSLMRVNDETVPTSLRAVGDHFFETLSIPLVAGRGLAADDGRGGDIAVVVNEAAAARIAATAGRDAVGALIQLPQPQNERNWMPATVVGVARNVRQQLYKPVVPEIYVSARKWPSRPWLNALVPTPLATAVRQHLARIVQQSAPVPIAEPETMDERMDAMMRDERFRTTLLTSFSGIAVALMVFGVFATLTFTATRRQRELGIRIALGAGPAGVVSALAPTVLWPLVLGVPAGLAAAHAGRAAVQSLVSEASATDLRIIAAAVALTVGAVLLASVRPILRAVTTTPVALLRDE